MLQGAYIRNKKSTCVDTMAQVDFYFIITGEIGYTIHLVLSLPQFYRNFAVGLRGFLEITFVIIRTYQHERK